MKGLLFIFSMTMITGAFAQDTTTTTTQNVSAETAMTIARAAALDCESKGFPVTATVVDTEGGDKAVYRSNGIGSYSVKAAHDKAFTSAATKRKTSELPTDGNLGDIDGFLLLPGGVPIGSGASISGAVGVSGAPSGQVDEQCAEAGIAQGTTPPAIE